MQRVFMVSAQCLYGPAQCMSELVDEKMAYTPLPVAACPRITHCLPEDSVHAWGSCCWLF